MSSCSSALGLRHICSPAPDSRMSRSSSLPGEAPELPQRLDGGNGAAKPYACNNYKPPSRGNPRLGTL
jgi:hypothetical protein